MNLFSAAFGNFEPIPIQYTAEGKDLSPPLRWNDVPEETQSLALICEDPDAPHGTWDHWILYNIPPFVNELAEGMKHAHLPEKARAGVNTAGTKEYTGPNPPSGVHRYFFKLYALDTELKLSGDVKKVDLLKAMGGHILAEATIVGLYELKK